MPELVEVRFLERNLRKEIVGAVIEGGEITHGNLVEFYHKDLIVSRDSNKALKEKNEEWNSLLEGAIITAVGRKGKYVIINTEAATLLMHMSFTGWVIPTWAEKIQPRRFLHPIGTEYTRVKIKTNRGDILISDPRALSRTRVFRSELEAQESVYLNRMGPDADSREAEERLREVIPKSRRRIRDLILDQKVVAGIGNYLCCEALHRAKLHGSEKSKDLSQDQILQLIGAIKSVIVLAEISEDKSWWQVFQRKFTPLGVPVVRESWGRRGHYTTLKSKVTA